MYPVIHIWVLFYFDIRLGSVTARRQDPQNDKRRQRLYVFSYHWSIETRGVLEQDDHIQPNSMEQIAKTKVVGPHFEAATQQGPGSTRTECPSSHLALAPQAPSPRTHTTTHPTTTSQTTTPTKTVTARPQADRYQGLRFSETTTTTPTTTKTTSIDT